MNDTHKLIKARREQLSVEAAEASANVRAQERQLRQYFAPLYTLMEESKDLPMMDTVDKSVLGTACHIKPRFIYTDTSLELCCIGGGQTSTLYRFATVRDSEGFPFIKVNVPAHFIGAHTSQDTALLARTMPADQAADMLLTLLAQVTL